MAMGANEVSREDLLLRDVNILFEENNRLKSEVEKLQKENDLLKEAKFEMEQEERDELAYYISCQREARGMSLKEFAKLVGTNGHTLSNYEKGKGRLSKMKETVTAISRIGRV